MTKTNFRFAPDILRRLGEELNPNPDQGVLELAKNAYDADALRCVIDIDESKGGQQTVTVLDDGIGMTAEAVDAGWLVLGRSSKSLSKPSRLGRRPSGSKGLGRLAALRMGRRALLVTRPIDDQMEHSLEIDWGRFDTAGVVEEVELEVVSRRRVADAKPGTTVVISDIQNRIDRAGATRIARELLLLADPFGDNPEGFQPILNAPGFSDLEKLVRTKYFEDAEFHLTAAVDENGFATAKVVDWKGGVLFEATHEKIRGKHASAPFVCPPASFDLWIFILDATTFSTRTSAMGEVKKWLKEVGGVHLYIRGLRVRPYGEPGHDWLDMNLRRSRSPELRPSTNTSVGRIRVEDLDEKLKQKTDRSGLIENSAYQDLRTFAQESIDWLVRERLAVRERGRQKERQVSETDLRKKQQQMDDFLRSVPRGKRAKAEAAYRTLRRSVDRDRLALQAEIQLYRTLSTAGIAAETFSHEAAHPIKVIRDNSRILEKLGQGELPDPCAKRIEKPVQRIRRQVRTLDAFTQLTLDFATREKRRRGRVNLHEIIVAVLEAFQPIFEERKVSPDPQLFHASPILLGSEAALESVLANHIINSLKAFERGNVGARRLVIRTEEDRGQVLLSIMDTGPGIKDLTIEEVWVPGETSDPNGTGLGLAIVRDTVADLGGTATAVANGELGGASFEIRLPVLEWKQ